VEEEWLDLWRRRRREEGLLEPPWSKDSDHMEWRESHGHSYEEEAVCSGGCDVE
jgi:hypothetical protein